tara:strand:- start:2164 stop:2721 length:558 start_codon:yes stop_codon:yes gene_type:complete
MATLTVYDIVRGINQAAANAYDGAHDKRFVRDGEDKPVGLSREEGCALNDSRVIDGFKVRISGPNLIVSYQSEMPLKSIHNMKLDEEIERIYASIIKFLKKEYKNITKAALTLTALGPCDIMLQNMSRVRTWIQCQKTYKIGSMTDVIPVGEPSEDRLSKDWKQFLDLNTDKKPKNVTRKNEKND